jgi:3-dehydro-4-phosphotetronate decarboxylase
MFTDLGPASREMQDGGRYLLAHGLTWGPSGNMSVRLGGGAFLVTARGTDPGNLCLDDFVACPPGGAPPTEVGSGATGSGRERRPSKEAPMHQAIYELRPWGPGAPTVSNFLENAGYRPRRRWSR